MNMESMTVKQRSEFNKGFLWAEGMDISVLKRHVHKMDNYLKKLSILGSVVCYHTEGIKYRLNCMNESGLCLIPNLKEIGYIQINPYYRIQIYVIPNWFHRICRKLLLGEKVIIYEN